MEVQNHLSRSIESLVSNILGPKSHKIAEVLEVEFGDELPASGSSPIFPRLKAKRYQKSREKPH